MFKNLSNKFTERMFKKVNNVVWDLSTGRIGVSTRDGIATMTGTGEDASIEINMMDDFGTAIPAFAQSTPLTAVTVGDMIYLNGKVKGWVVSVDSKPATPAVADTDGNITKPATEGSTKFKIISPTGTINNWNPPKVSMLGMGSGVMVVRSLMTMLPGGETGLKNMENSLLPLMMMGGNDSDIESILPMLLMSQTTASDSNSSTNMMNMMMQMKMMKMMTGDKSGKNTLNFFDN